MGALPRPDLQPGPHRDLVDALHGLHHRAGWPSLRVLARGAGCSPTTVSAVFSSPRLPTWGVLELLVEAMGGDVEPFRELWQAAGSPPGSPVEVPAASARIAGRAPELATVRRHLTAGAPGLLLVTGEAGIGKTRLVDVASALASRQVFVAGGACLPLSTAVPLLPIATILRATYDVDHGQWLKEALTDAAPYVSASLRRLLPELDLIVDAPVEPDDEWSRQRLFTAVGSTLAGLTALRPLAVVVEDLHWADAMTLDLLEHLLTSGPGLPVVGTWRQDDPAVAASVRDWFSRVRRLPDVDELALHPLTRDGTAEQLALLSGEQPDQAEVDRIHRRTAGQPLFTEQLAAQAGDDQPLPDVLADLLDRRLDGLDEPAWRIARALGVADRPLADGLLSEVTTLASAELAAGLHQLSDRRLLHPTGDRDVQLRHPLLAEAIRRRLVRPESVDEHRRIAAALADTPDPAPSEVAEHWQRAEDPVEEIVWRIRAARAAGQRLAWPQESEQWLRVLELWPDGTAEAGVPPVTRAAAYLAAMEALKAAVQFDRAAALSDEATRRLTDVEAAVRADLLTRAAEFRGVSGSAEAGLELLEQALEIYSTLPPSAGYLEALDRQRDLLLCVGRYDAAHQVARSAVEAAERLGVPLLRRSALASLAWHEAEAGDLVRGLQTADEAYALVAPGSDPLGDMWIGVIRTDILLCSGAGADAVEAAGTAGLAVAATSGIGSSWTAVLLRCNISEALTRSGLVGRAAALIDPETDGAFDVNRWPVHLERAHLDVIRGRLGAARDRWSEFRNDSTDMLHRSETGIRVDFVNYAALLELWDARPERAMSLVMPFLEDSVSTDGVSLVGPTFVLAARSAADVVEHEARAGRARGDSLRDVMELRARARVDPFTTTNRADGPAHRATWQAETARLAGQPSLELWATAAGAWDKLSRPHDAAYCRWRGAQAALAIDQGTIALRLLRRAVREAREHVPLSAAIAETTEKARRAPHPAERSRSCPRPGP